MPEKKKIAKLSHNVAATQKKIQEITNAIKPATARPTLKIGQKEIFLKKAVLNPNFTNKTVLTDSTWRYVEIFLKEKEANEALF